jgi:CubicO group peptidase (beta-lactamase class C family)
MRDRLLFAVFAMSLSACSASPSLVGSARNGALADRVDSLLAPLVAAHEFSGAIVMARNGQTLYARGFGLANHAAQLSFTPDTPADGGSLAKTFTAAGVWWLAHEGKVDLDAAVQHYIPEYPHPQTTVRQLLSHSNGLPTDYELFRPHFGPDEVWTTSAMLRLTRKLAPQPSFDPGSRYEYSNIGFDAAGLLIERVSGQSYETFVKERFFTPLGLRSSLARPARLADYPGRRTVGYRWRDGDWQVHDSYDNEGFLGGSNLFFSAADMVRLGIAHANGTALPRAVFESGQQNLQAGGQPLYVTGLSWYCDERKVRCNYSGHNNGFHCFLFWDRERNETLAFISNSTLPAWATATLQRQLVRALAGHPPEVDAPATFIEVVDVDPAGVASIKLAEIVGAYTAAGSPTLTLTAGPGGGVRARYGRGLEYDAYPAARQVLYVPGLDFYLAFSGDAAGRAMHVKSQEQNLVLRRS